MFAVACVRGEPRSAPGTPGPATAPEEPASPAPPRSPYPEVVRGDGVGDGRWFGFIEDAEADERTITFDQAYMLGYDEANQAYLRDGGPDAEYGVPNDYHIQNLSSQLWTVPLAADARVRVVNWGTDTELVDGDVDDFLGAVDDPPEPGERYSTTASAPHWFTIEDGEIRLIEEQWLP